MKLLSPAHDALLAPFARKVVDVWDLPPPARHLSSVKRSLTSSMRYLPRTAADGNDGANVSFADEGGEGEVRLVW